VLPWACWDCTFGGVAARGGVVLVVVGVGGDSTVEVTVGDGASAGEVAAGGGLPALEVGCSAASAVAGRYRASTPAAARARLWAARRLISVAEQVVE
jgi:hypothetical protein